MFVKYGFAFLKHGSLWAYRFSFWAVLVLGLGFAVGVVALRYLLLPSIDSYRQPIASAVSAAVGQEVSIGRIEGNWRGYRPELRLFDVRIHEPGGQVALTLSRVDTVLSWVSLLAGQLNFHVLEISRPSLEIRRDSLGLLWIAGDPVGGDGGGQAGLRNWLLKQRQIIVRDARITWIDEMRSVRPLVIEQADLRIDNEADRHRFGLTGQPPMELASRVSLRGELTGNDLGELAQWRGRLYAEFEYANLALATTWIPMPVAIGSGLGALRLWIDVAGRRVVAATADVNLVNVRAQLRGDLAWLDLASLSGRLGWRQERSAAVVSGRALAVRMNDGGTLAPFDFSLRRAAGSPTSYTLALARLELAPFAALAPYLPVGADLRERVAALEPRGYLSQAQLAWHSENGAMHVDAADAAFESLALRPLGRLPGVSGFSGSLAADAGGGKLSLKSERGSVELPAVLAMPVPLDFLAAEADWTVKGGVTEVTVRSASFTNAHVAGSAFGRYRFAPDDSGTVDISASLVRAEAADVWRYVPNRAANTRAWLQRALTAGRATDAKLVLSGRLRDFPYRGGSGGRFEVVTQVEGVRLDYARGWPALEAVAGEVAFRNDGMQVSGRAGRIFDVDIAGTRASIEALGGHAEHLRVSGEARGPVAGFLRYVKNSPIAGYVGHATDEMAAEGPGRLSLALDLPLHETAATRVSGRFEASGSRFTISPQVPALTDYRTTVAFSERSVTFSDGYARFLGGPLRFAGGSRQGGGVEVTMAGTLSAAELGRYVEHPLWRAVRGDSEWQGRLLMRDKVATLSVQSNLKGIGSVLPPPLDKVSAAALPLAFELEQRAGGQRALSLALGERLSARAIVDGDRLRRASVGFGVPAPPPAQDGIGVFGKLAMLDIDAWRDALRPPASAVQAAGGDSAGDGGPGLAAIDLAIGALDVGARRFSDVAIAAQRTADGWRATLQARQGKGEASWASAQGGRLSARFSRLVIPAQSSSLTPVTAAAAAPEWRKALPGLDVSAEDFTFEGKPLGRLELQADPEARRWHLRRLRISNPDGVLDIVGQWAATDLPRTDLQVKVNASDVGRLLGRLGYPEGIKGGSGSLVGPVSWVGNPYRPDVPTLSGQLKLEASNGRFAKAEPGAAKLLGILSLQALPRRLSLDFADLFSSGFSFERIDANVVLANGVAQTDDFRMTGSAARVQMQGRVDLAAETQDLQVRVFPQLSTAAAVAGAIVNPAVGVATLVLQKALGDPVEELAARDYRVSGTWEEPIVQPVARDSNTTSPRK